MKAIIKIVLLPSVVQSNFMKWREYFLYAKKIKITTFIQQFISSPSLIISVAPFWRASDGRKVWTLFSVISNKRIHIVRLFTIWFERKQRIHSLRMSENSVHTLCPSGDTLTRRGDNCWINVVICIFFAYKKYSRRFIKFRLNLWFLHELWFSVTSHHVYL